MNLTRVLNNALPDIPARTLSESYPRLDPNSTSRTHLEGGKPMVRIYVPSNGYMYKLPPPQWALAQLFDGKRSYEKISELYSQQSGIQYSSEAIREFAGDLEGAEFWYKTSQEKNILLIQQTKEERRKTLAVRSKWADLSVVVFPAFNPDRFLNWLYSKTEFIYTTWFTTLTLIVFAIATWITVTHWTEIGRDTVAFYNFSNKTWADLFVLYGLGMFVVALHEFAHAHTCKHYGGRVPAMGFALVYLAPAFYTDTTEGTVLGTQYQRLVISMAGVWSELIVCSIATPIWWGTPPNTLIHDGAYFTMMMTGIMALIVNWNPLMKLDGYYMLCDIIGISDLKEDSTAYVSAWVKRKIWRLPVEVPYVARRRRLGFVVYALLSGAYSYTVLYIVARFAGNIVRNFSPEWGFIPELAVAALVFRSRIRLLVNFMKFVYLDKKDRIIAWFTLQHSLAVTAAFAIFLALPLWHESVSGKFLLEPMQSAVVRAHVPGIVTHMFAKEGDTVEAGAPLATLRNVSLQSEFEDAQARLVLASDHVNAASLHYSEYGAALREREHLTTQVQQLSEMNATLNVASPITGTVLTPRVQDLVGSYATEGSQLVEVADLSALRARIFISEYDLSNIHEDAAARLQVQGTLRIWDAHVFGVAAWPREMDPKLLREAELKGTNPPHFFLVDLVVQNPKGQLKSGMIGVARVYGRRRSLFGLGWQGFSNFWGRKLW
jgi:putative peptide zinc metalloprotease protein